GCNSAECSPQKSDALGGAGAASSTRNPAASTSDPADSTCDPGDSPDPTEEPIAREPPRSGPVAAGPNGTSSSLGPSQSRGSRTTLLSVVPSSVSRPSLSTPR